MRNCNVTVSILVTFYNQEKYVDEALQSVFSQETTFPIEVLLGDDGSNDGTYEKLLKWQEKYKAYCQVFRMPRNEKIKYEPIIRASRNRLNLLQHASGKYIIFLDGDDYYLDQKKIQKQVDILQRHSECIACGHPVMLTSAKGADMKLGKISDTRHCILSAKQYWALWYLHVDSLLFRNILNAEQINSFCADDFDDNLITFCYLPFGDIYYLPDVMVAYRQVEGSSWNRRSYLEKILLNLQDYLKEKTIYPQYSKEALFRHCSDLMWLYLHPTQSREVHNPFALYKDNFIKKAFYYKSMTIKEKIKFKIIYSYLPFLVIIKRGWIKLKSL